MYCKCWNLVFFWCKHGTQESWDEGKKDGCGENINIFFFFLFPSAFPLFFCFFFVGTKEILIYGLLHDSAASKRNGTSSNVVFHCIPWLSSTASWYFMYEPADVYNGEYVMMELVEKSQMAWYGNAFFKCAVLGIFNKNIFLWVARSKRIASLNCFKKSYIRLLQVTKRVARYL